MQRPSVAALLAAAVALVAAAWLLSPLDPVAVRPSPAMAMDGPLAPNDALHARTAIPIAGDVHGPEDVAVGRDGALYIGVAEGQILRLYPQSGETFELVRTGGRPLGLAFAGAGTLVAAIANVGLIGYGPDGSVVPYADQAEGVPIRVADDVDVGPDGAIYASDASTRHPLDDYRRDVLEGHASGRLLRHDPAAGTTTVLLDGLQFANGVAVAADGRSVLVAETGAYRVRRVWLDGPRAGSNEVFVDRLPGFPDGISRRTAGGYWLALVAPRSRILDALHPHPFLKALMGWLPTTLWPQPHPWGMVLALDDDGRVLGSLQDLGGAAIATITSVEEHGGYLYLGTLDGDFVGRVPVPEFSG